jgi:hypothetical protein
MAPAASGIINDQDLMPLTKMKQAAAQADKRTPAGGEFAGWCVPLRFIGRNPDYGVSGYGANVGVPSGKAVGSGFVFGGEGGTNESIYVSLTASK